MSPIATIHSTKIRLRNITKSAHLLSILVLVIIALAATLLPDFIMAVGASQEQRPTYEVNTLADDPDGMVGDGLCQTAENQCTLRAAIEEAQSARSTGADRIEFTLSGQIELINGALPKIVDDLTIVGTDELLVDGGERSRIFSVNSEGILHLEKLTLANGKVDSEPANGGLIYNTGQLSLQQVILSGGAANQGGAIYNLGQANLVQVQLRDNQSRFHGGAIYTTGEDSQLTLDNVTLHENHATLGYGGAIYSELGATVQIESSQLGREGQSNGANRGAGIYNSGGAVTLVATTIAYNSAAGNGSGLYIADGGTMTVTNSTLSHNRADNDGGALYLENPGHVHFNHATVTGNRADGDGNGSGDGGAFAIALSGILTDTITGTVQFQNSIIADNHGNEQPNCGTMADESQPGSQLENVLSSGLNIWGDDIGCPVQEDDFNLAALGLTIDQLLSTDLQNYGGETQTHSLVRDSLALDQGTQCATLLSIDQRGLARPQGDGCDIGAFESVQVDLGVTKSVDPTIVQPGEQLTYQLFLVNNGPGPASNVIVADWIPSEVQITSASSAGLFITEVDPPALQKVITTTAMTTATLRAWSVGTMAAGESGIIQLTGILTDSAISTLTPGGSVLNQAIILPQIADIDPLPGNNLDSAIFYMPHQVHELTAEDLPLAHRLDVPLNPQLTLHSTGDIAAIADLEQSFFVYGMLNGYYTFTTPCHEECPPNHDLNTLQTTIQGPLQPGEKLFASVTAGLLDSHEIPHVPHLWQFTTRAPYGTGNFNTTARLVDPQSSDGGLTTQQAVLGDLDGDGDLDALLANRAKSEQVWLNDGAGGFRKGTDLTSITQSWAVALGDLDADGDLDAFVAGNNPGGLGQANRVWLNDGKAQFADSGQLLGASNSRGVALGDLNSDGRLDVVVANTDGQPNTVWLNDGDAIFSHNSQVLGTSYSNDVAVGDIDNDGDLDILFANGRNLARDLSTDGLELDDAANSIWINDGTGQFQQSQQQLGQSDSHSVILGDIDGDHDLDTLVINGSNQGNRLWINDGMGHFTERDQGLGSGECRDGILGDLDSDGDLDAIIVGYNQANVAWFNDGKGNFKQDGQQIGYFSSLGIALGDLKGDGSMDALITTDGEGNHLWFNEASADLAIVQRIEPPIVAPGDRITYTLVYTNYGPGTARNIEIRDDLPMNILNLDIDLAQASGMTLAETNGTTLIWRAQQIPANSSGTIIVNGDVAPSVAINTILSNTVSIKGEPETELGNNQSESSLKVGITSVQFASSVYEVAEGSTVARLEIELEKPNPFTDVSISYEIVGGTAEASIDYLRAVTQTAMPTDAIPTVIIPVGETRAMLELPIIDDSHDELNETLIIRLATPLGAFLGAQATTTLTIIDDDPTPTATIQDVSIMENSLTALFDIRLSAPSNLPISVAYRTLDQSATTNNDYTAASGAVNIPPGITHYSLLISLRDDALHEGDEQFQVALSNPSNVVLTDNRGIATLLDDDRPPLLAVDELTSDEGAGTVLLNVHLSEVSGVDVRADLITVNDSAMAGYTNGDYVEQAYHLLIPAGEIGTTLPLVIHDDQIDEPNEAFFIELRNVQNARLFDEEESTHLSRVQIIDNDGPPTLDFKQENDERTYRVNEYSPQATLSAQLSHPSSRVITASYTTQDESAVSEGDDFDYTATSGLLTFEPGSTEQPITIPIRSDSLMESRETLLVALADPRNVMLGRGQIELNIIDDDGPLPLVDFSHISYDAQEGSEALITVQMAGVQLVDGQNCEQQPDACEQSSIVVGYEIDDPLNALVQPYQGTFTFTADTATQRLRLETQDDKLYRGDTKISLRLLDSTSAHLGANNPAHLIIHENDPLPTINLSAPAYQFNEDQTTAQITATLQGSTTQTATVHYKTPSLSTVYYPLSTILLFPAGTVSQTITIPIQDDPIDEPDETLEIRLIEPTYATLGENDTALLTIVDDDPMPVLNFSQPRYTIGESEGIAHLDIDLSAPSALSITASYQSSDDSARVGQDYMEVAGSLFFKPGITRQTIELPILSDEITEADESILVSLYGLVNGAEGRNNPATVEILDNDSILPRVQFHTPVYSVDEGQSRVVTVTLSMASNETVTIDYATADQSARAEEGEYTPVSGTLIFTPGTTSQTFSIPTGDDLLDEANKEVALLLSNPTNGALGTNALATLTILDDEELPSVAFEQEYYSVIENRADAEPVIITVALAATSNLTVTINYATTDGSATSGITGDYLSANGTLIFPPGITRQSFPVVINVDAENEPDEDLLLRLFNPHNAFLGEIETAILSIEDSNFPIVSFLQPRYEGLENSGLVTIAVGLSSASVSTVTVEYATDIANDGESAGENNSGLVALQQNSDRDYEPTRGLLEFLPGETEKHFTVTLLDDDVDEKQEAISMALFNPTRAFVDSDAQAYLAILDDDPQPEIRFSNTNYRVNENGTSTTIVVQLSAPSGLTVVADYVAEDISTTAGTQKSGDNGTAPDVQGDYESVAGILRFEPGVTSQTFTIILHDDDLEEGVETAQLKLLNIQNATAPVGVASLTIFDDETPLGTDLRQIDFRVTALEVTQGVQNLANTMPLVADRVTLVRVYAQTESAIQERVNARLRAFRDGVELAGSPIAANNNPITIHPDGGDRANINDSFWFYVRPAWRKGSVTFVAEVGYDDAQPESTANNNFNTTVTFYEGQPLRLRTVPVTLYNGSNSNSPLTYSLSDAQFGPLLDNLLRYHPIPRIALYSGQVMDATTFASPHYTGWNLQEEASQLELLRTLWWTDLFTSGEPQDMHWMAMLHAGIDTGKQSAHSLGPGRDFWVKMDPENRIWPAWYLSGGSSMAYAVAYNRGASTLRCVGNEKDADLSFPWSYAPPPNAQTCSLSAVDPKGYYGLDVYHPSWGQQEPQVISNDPQADYLNRAQPLMSDAHPQWTTPYTYCQLLNSYGITCDLCTIEPQSCIQNNRKSATSSLHYQLSTINYPDQLQGPLLMVGGIVDFIRDERTELREVYLFDDARNALLSDDKIWRLMRPILESLVDSRAPKYRIAQVNRAGETLQSQDLKLRTVDHEGQETHLFFTAMLQMTEMDRVELRDEGDNVLASRTLTGSPPAVKLLEPTEGTLVAGTLIRWQATDPDDDTLRFTILYSPDSGTHWQTLALGVTQNTFTLSADAAAHLAGSEQGQLQVIAHDGFYTAQDRSPATFQVANKPPVGLLLWPAEETQTLYGKRLILRGLGTDVEDGSLVGEQLQWSSDLDGPLGSGTELAVDALSPGNHLLLLTVRDSTGAERQAFTTVLVVKPPLQLYLPLIYR